MRRLPGLLVALTCVMSTPVDAQAVSTLSGLNLAQLSPMVARIELDFVPVTPRYRIDGSNTNQITLTLANTSRRPTVMPGVASFGPLKSIDLRDSPGMVAVVFLGDVPLHAQVVPAARALVLLITTTSPEPPGLSALAAVGNDVSLVRLRYADINEIAELLGSASQPDPLGQSTGGFQGGSGLSGSTLGTSTGVATTTLTGTSALPPVGVKVSDIVSVDRRLNAVVLTGPTATVESLKKLIAAIDTPVPSVLLEVSVVELSETAAKDLGIDFSNGAPLGTVSAVVKSGGVPQGTLSLQALVYGAVQKGEGHIIARPRILVESGTPASILTGDSIPIFTNISYPGSGSSIVQQQVQYVNVGVSLLIAATVDEANVVHARVQASVSSVTSYSQGVPQISQRQATTNASVQAGSSLVIGGLVQENDLSSSTAVPGLSSIPLIGGLFRVHHVTKQHTDLYIVITPTVDRQ
jgi:general secretion pathway protein D